LIRHILKHKFCCCFQTIRTGSFIRLLQDGDKGKSPTAASFITTFILKCPPDSFVLECMQLNTSYSKDWRSSFIGGPAQWSFVRVGSRKMGRERSVAAREEECGGVPSQ
jgi:hypothetical protein